MQRKKFDSINVVPFIDIMLVLLVIVLTTASFIQVNNLKVNLPTSQTQEEFPNKKELSFEIDKKGIIYFNGKLTQKKSIAQELNKYPKDTTVKIYCDKESKFDNFVNILSTIKSLGYNNVGIVTKDE